MRARALGRVLMKSMLTTKERKVKKEILETTKAPAAIGPYSQGYAFGDLVITSGQIPVDPATGAIPEGIAAQADIKTTCFLADIADFAAFNEVYAKYFTSKPARSCVAVKELPKGVLCEIEAIAVK